MSAAMTPCKSIENDLDNLEPPTSNDYYNRHQIPNSLSNFLANSLIYKTKLLFSDPTTDITTLAFRHDGVPWICQGLPQPLVHTMSRAVMIYPIRIGVFLEDW
jgi:hypothetical protein